jgi:formylglycine-generating enzyme required for sulfatase activity
MKHFFTCILICALAACSGTKTRQPVKKPKTVKNSIGMEFVKIPSGKVTVGCVEGDKYCAKDEKPATEVEITKQLFVSIYETTLGQFRKFIEETGYTPSSKFSTNKDYPDNYPVCAVSWNDTQKFIKWLNAKETDKTYRLPTEAEWEYLCRAGEKTIYCFGNEDILLKRYAWFWNNANKHPHEVGTKKANNWGIYDVHGNVYEWTSSWYNENYYKNMEKKNPQGPTNGDRKVYKGGGFLCNPDYCRASFRNYAPIDNASEAVGFRLVYELKQKQEVKQ